MGTEPRGDLTAILGEARDGRDDAQERLVCAIDAELRRTAGGLLRHEQPGHTLQPSALVHEALLRLLDGDALADLPDHRYLFLAAAQAMRRVLGYFGGLSVPEVAEALAVSDTTVEGDWRFARAWLHDQLGGATP